MSIIDWIGNSLIHRRDIPMPYSYKTVEEWEKFYSTFKLKLVQSQYLGFSKDFFHPGTYGLLILEKTNETLGSVNNTVE